MSEVRINITADISEVEVEHQKATQLIRDVNEKIAATEQKLTHFRLKTYMMVSAAIGTVNAVGGLIGGAVGEIINAVMTEIYVIQSAFMSMATGMGSNPFTAPFAVALILVTSMTTAAAIARALGGKAELDRNLAEFRRAIDAAENIGRAIRL